MSNFIVTRDKDSFFRDERGLLSMPHLTAFFAALFGAALLLNGFIAFWIMYDGWLFFVQFGTALIASSAGLEGYQTTIESRNQRNAT